MARTRATDFADKQRAILASAAAVFAEAGMDKASMAQVAAQAQVSKALLYHYYPGKDALIFDIVHSHLQRLEEAVFEADAPALKPRARLRQMVGAVLETYRDADDAHKVQLNGTPGLPEAERAELHAIERRIVRRFAAVLCQVNPALDGPRALLMPVTMSLFGMLNWVYLWFREGGAISRDEYAELATRLMLNGVEGLR
ncbi:MAG: TetR/AcrR family transcriptional regulator [Pararhodobacter sp.]